MAAFSFLSPAILVAGLSLNSNKAYEYLPMASMESCSLSGDNLVKNNFIGNGYSICLDTGFPTIPNNNYSSGMNTRIPVWLIALINNDYEYIAMNDMDHCNRNKDQLILKGFVSRGWTTPYAICITTGFPTIK